MSQEFASRMTFKIFRSRVCSLLAELLINIQSSKNFIFPKMYAGKRIIVIGPAESSLQWCTADIVESFDVIVRINSSFNLTSLHGERLGKRTDVLAHSLYEGGPRGTGVIELSEIARAGTNLILCPLPNKDKWRPFLLVKRRLMQQDWRALGGFRPDVKFSPTKHYTALKTRLNGVAPTTGLATLNFFLQSNCAELHITGFTFFTGSYAPGYKPGVESVEETRNWVAASKHDALKERKLFSAMLDEARLQGMLVSLDPALNTIVEYEKHN